MWPWRAGAWRAVRWACAEVSRAVRSTMVVGVVDAREVDRGCGEVGGQAVEQAGHPLAVGTARVTSPLTITPLALGEVCELDHVAPQRDAVGDDGVERRQEAAHRAPCRPRSPSGRCRLPASPPRCPRRRWPRSSWSRPTMIHSRRWTAHRWTTPPVEPAAAPRRPALQAPPKTASLEALVAPSSRSRPARAAEPIISRIRLGSMGSPRSGGGRSGAYDAGPPPGVPGRGGDSPARSGRASC